MNIIGVNMQKAIIKNACLEQLQRLEPVRKIRQNKKKHAQQDMQIDAVFDIETDQEVFTFHVSIKGVLKRPIPDHLFILGKSNSLFLVMAEYVNDAIARDLKKNKINFIDSVGNSFIHIPRKIYLNIQGKTPLLEKEKKTTALFQPKGLQLLFLLLKNPEALNQKVRELAKDADLSTGWVVQIFKEMKEKIYIYSSEDKAYRFANKKDLLEQWLANYGDRLRPKLVLGTYKILPRLLENVPEILKETFKNDPDAYAIGGSLGADLLIYYYRGYTTEIFVRPDELEILKKNLKLIPAKETDVTVLNLFSKHVIHHQQKIPYSIAHPLLIYAELLYHGGHGSREAETAERIFNEYLKQDFDET